MKLTKEKLGKLIQEAVVETNFDLDHWAARVDLRLGEIYRNINSIKKDVSHDLKELEISIRQGMAGEAPSRFGAPERKPTIGAEEGTLSEMKITKSQLKQIIKEELEKALNERGFGEGEPAKDGWSKKRQIQLEDDAHPGQSCDEAHAEQTHEEWAEKEDLEETKKKEKTTK